jgi:6-phosphogluconate dehydrogenase
VQEAVRLGVPAPVISAALFARFVSQDPMDVEMRAIAALRNQFGGHSMERVGSDEPEGGAAAADEGAPDASGRA